MLSCGYVVTLDEFDELCDELVPDLNYKQCSYCEIKFDPVLGYEHSRNQILCPGCVDAGRVLCFRCGIICILDEYTEIEGSAVCEDCADGMTFYYCHNHEKYVWEGIFCVGCDEEFCDECAGATIDGEDYCRDCSEAMDFSTCEICGEGFTETDKCAKCGYEYCDGCRHTVFSELCENCDREAYIDEHESIKITRKVTEQDSNNCWICQKKIWHLKNDPRRTFNYRYGTKFGLMRQDMGPELFKEYCARNNIIVKGSDCFDMNVPVQLPFPEVYNGAKTMITACKCGPCHVVCLYKLRRADPNKFFLPYPQRNQKLLFQKCLNCDTVWKNELYMMFCDDQEFNSYMNEQDKHEARAGLAVVAADNIATAHEWSEIVRHDEKFKGSYALTNIPEDVVNFNLNEYLEMPGPQPSAARLLKDDRRVYNVKKAFGRDASQSIYRAADFLDKLYKLPTFVYLDIDKNERERELLVPAILEVLNNDYRGHGNIDDILRALEELDDEFDESLPLCVLSTQPYYDQWRLMKQHYDLPGFFNSFRLRDRRLQPRPIKWRNLVLRLVEFERGNQGEGKE